MVRRNDQNWFKMILCSILFHLLFPQTFLPGMVSIFTVRTELAVYPIYHIKIINTNDGSDSKWFLDKILILDTLTEDM